MARDLSPAPQGLIETETLLSIVHLGRAAGSPGLIDPYTAPREPPGTTASLRKVRVIEHCITVGLDARWPARDVAFNNVGEWTETQVNGQPTVFFNPHQGFVHHRFAPRRATTPRIFTMDDRAGSPAASAVFRPHGSEADLFDHPHYTHHPLRHASASTSFSSDASVDPRNIFHHDQYLSSIQMGAEPHQTTAVSNVPAYYPFRSSELSTSTLTIPPGPIKIDTSPPLSTPTVLPIEVDVTKYEPLEYEEWLRTPTEYTGSPPDTATSPTDETPGTPPDFAIAPDWRRGSACSTTDEHVLHAFTPNPFQAALEKNIRGRRLSYPDHYQFFPQPLDSYSLSAGPIPTTNWSMPPAYTENHINFNRLTELSASASPQDIERPLTSLSVSSASTRPAAEEDDDHDQDGPSAQPPTQQSSDYNERNDLLLDLRNKGHSYKEIKRLGRFREAESTLRGRFRMLTKEKWERVRKPQWKGADIALLRRAVKHFRQDGVESSRNRRAAKKMPWKKIGEWMQEHGSSYTFAPATCAKKWDEIAA
ncbi:uncharacterized protein LTR77_003729 [Saxophila tyrrhenica]|uniref:Myb-like domain-containing protein n=1 Tax=Saxophila tyrrhenica TaxID=1690608 RepID=A0AAV9PHC9_9PEZI|nr:hypothetical protein LTR77_003729 [Saxophila tyrrhenica]